MNDKNNKIKGIKKTVTEINNNRRLHHNIMLDKSKKSVWCDSFPDCNSYCDYKNKDIVCLGVWKNYPLYDENVTMKDIQEMIDNC